ncbi:MAG: tryptophan halogenase [Microcystis aeruginosa Ma_MB_F_20061100_S19]|uniref:Geranylgeranyl reductase family protein n=1 Tax=Microcystis aeruginosa SPC777 TaxID=482300 RepID=S3IVY4_MICAE|nr:tryptophan 7-halogenase [Microcystis aeruginosa]NCR97788.1 tryptophan halogenase [Microcystis aeruginosa L311-01]OCY12181.1 MAG: tryptophan halogenase [Microcystis aeruginosa CACIAM 03]TRU09450.1 MAG: tryptophan halogenase [Microcystis aeruginosa Ma_MB_F_20061100_S19D]TRU16543.1 MAG: tryptophan halogenase [Microcystis aeruginosa Ma_MB_F_20061100_S19]EPF17105.1 geranylgeranyl reductase family protein [Microcystis aeruginosa SPC777]
MKNMSNRPYDVIIMGAGLAGLCQARHLMLKIPNIRIAMIDPRPENRTEKDLKLGESTVEVATLFFGKDLGLYEYLIENHPPKYGLNFHWPKRNDQTKTIDDYFHIWANRQPDLASTQLNRPKFERDLLKMNREMGADFYNGRVVDIDLTPNDQLHTVKVKLPNESIELQGKHLVDAAGRRFLIGKKTNNISFDSKDLYGVNTGSAWVRVQNVDRTIFHSGYDPTGASCSHYYATNHWFGKGHWLWMIPTDIETMELSIGVIHHHDYISSESLNSKEKFYEFLKANHNILYQLVTSAENIDFHYWPRLAHTSKTLYSPDNWYVIGDSACIFDAFYSLGSTMIVSAIDSITEIIRAKLAGEVNAAEKCQAYNQFNLTLINSINLFMHNHSRHLGDASIMSWRIYFENMIWFGILIPIFVGKWHLDLEFIPQFVQTFQTTLRSLVYEIHDQFDQLVDEKKNIGLMDCYRSDQLIWNYHTPKRYTHALENAQYEPKQTSVFTSMKKTFFYLTIWYLKLQWKSGGLSQVCHPRSLGTMAKLLTTSIYIGLGDIIYSLTGNHGSESRLIAEMRQAFQEYQYGDTLQPWTVEGVDTKSLEMEAEKVPLQV